MPARWPPPRSRPRSRPVRSPRRTRSRRTPRRSHGHEQRPMQTRQRAGGRREQRAEQRVRPVASATSSTRSRARRDHERDRPSPPARRAAGVARPPRGAGLKAVNTEPAIARSTAPQPPVSGPHRQSVRPSTGHPGQLVPEPTEHQHHGDKHSVASRRSGARQAVGEDLSWAAESWRGGRSGPCPRSADARYEACAVIPPPRLRRVQPSHAILLDLLNDRAAHRTSAPERRATA